jgi:hypothetical protein
VTYSVSPPDTAVWYDPADILAEALARLRLTDADVDADRIATLIPVAARSMDFEMDRPIAPPGPPPAPELREALVLRVIDLHQIKAPTANTGFGAPPPFDASRDLIAPHKQRWGWA